MTDQENILIRSDITFVDSTTTKKDGYYVIYSRRECGWEQCIHSHHSTFDAAASIAASNVVPDARVYNPRTQSATYPTR